MNGLALNQVHAQFLALLAHVLGPDAGLCLAHVALLQEYHAQAALTDTATDAQGKCAFQKTTVEIEFLAVCLSLEFQLVKESQMTKKE